MGKRRGPFILLPLVTRERSEHHAGFFRRKLQGEASAPSEQADAFRRHPDDRREPAALLLGLALGAGAVRRGLGLPVRRARRRGQQPRLLPQPRLPPRRPALAPAPRARRRRPRPDGREVDERPAALRLSLTPPMHSPRLQNSAELTRALARVVEAGGVAVLATLVEAERGVGAKVLCEADGGRTGTTGDAALDA